jgi:hypothetical protein
MIIFAVFAKNYQGSYFGNSIDYYNTIAKSLKPY